MVYDLRAVRALLLVAAMLGVLAGIALALSIPVPKLEVPLPEPAPDPGDVAALLAEAAEITRQAPGAAG